MLFRDRDDGVQVMDGVALLFSFLAHACQVPFKQMRIIFADAICTSLQPPPDPFHRHPYRRLVIGWNLADRVFGDVVYQRVPMRGDQFVQRSGHIAPPSF